MSHHPRRILSPGASRKRKAMEAFYTAKPSTPPSTAVVSTAPCKATEPVASNRLLAGYMAHEFLTKGTLFGQKWDPARAEAVPVWSGLGESKRTKPGQSQSVETEPSGRVKHLQHHQSYAEMARLLMGDGAHVPGIVSPTQLARWIQM